MDVSSLSADPVSVASLSTALSSDELGAAVAVAVLGKAQESQAAILSLLMASLGVGQNLDVLA